MAQQKINIKPSKNGLQFGFAIKSLFEFSTVKKTQAPLIKIGLSGGLGSSFIDNNIYPSVNVDFLLYNNGIGSSKPGNNKPSLNFDFITALTLTAGVKDYLQQNRQQLFINRNVPLYYFADLAMPALKNPFENSISVGTNFIASNSRKFQRTGFLNLHINRFQVSYSNDGGYLISEARLGDRKDRYYTGSAVISYHGKPNTAINLIELSYHKFTGYSKNAFEVTNLLDFAFVNYKETAERFFNKSMFTLNIANPVKGFAMQTKLYNKTNWDIQHLIHFSLYNGYHIVPYKQHLSFSGSYYFLNTSIGLK